MGLVRAEPEKEKQPPLATDLVAKIDREVRREKRQQADRRDPDLLVTTSSRPGLHAKLTAIAKSLRCSRNKLVLDIFEKFCEEHYPEVSEELTTEDEG